MIHSPLRLFILLVLVLAWCGRDGLRGQTPAPPPPTTAPQSAPGGPVYSLPNGQTLPMPPLRLSSGNVIVMLCVPDQRKRGPSNKRSIWRLGGRKPLPPQSVCIIHQGT